MDLKLGTIFWRRKVVEVKRRRRFVVVGGGILSFIGVREEKSFVGFLEGAENNCNRGGFN